MDVGERREGLPKGKTLSRSACHQERVFDLSLIFK
jgi:hypothetical protein